MKKHKWLFQDAVTHKPLPFSSQTRLQLLGFFMPDDQTFPAPLEMLAERGSQRYRISHAGYMHELSGKNAYDMREPDIATEPGRTVKPGDVAFALGPSRVVTGSEREMRSALRYVLRTEMVGPAQGLAVLEYLQRQPAETLLARAYEKGGLQGYTDQQTWLGLREKIRACHARPRVLPGFQPKEVKARLMP